ncbi:hypothetical protein N665_5713s0001 [Sinapis alba]|nr:hypothetical protein N665_5713s0001 [Sinapis alba]
MYAYLNVFHVSQLRKCLTDQIFLPEIPADLGKNLTLETRPVRIVDRSEKPMKKKTVPMIKVVWDYNGEDLITWETEARMKAEYPEWYSQFLREETLNSDSRTNFMLVGETCHVHDPR